MSQLTTCQECGFAYGVLQPAQIPAAIAEVGPEFAGRLRRTDPAELRHRPRPWVWSGLEYACHVRDMLLVQRDRLYIALVEDTPSFAKMHRDERVSLARYNDQDPEQVASELELAARLASQSFAALDYSHWLRPLIYNYPTPTTRTIAWMGEHTVHEGRHHREDLDRDLDASAWSARPAPAS